MFIKFILINVGNGIRFGVLLQFWKLSNAIVVQLLQCYI